MKVRGCAIYLGLIVGAIGVGLLPWRVLRQSGNPPRPRLAWPGWSGDTFGTFYRKFDPAETLSLRGLSVSKPHLGTRFRLTEPLAYCFAPGTPPEIMNAFTQATQLGDSGALAFFTGGSWNSVATPRHFTWSLVPDGTTVPSTGADDNGGLSAPSELFSRMDALFREDRALWIGLIAQAFDRWSQLTGASYSQVTLGGNDWDDGGAFWTSARSNTRGDFRIAMRNIDNASRVIAFNFFPTNGDMVLDRSENWALSRDNFRFMRNVIMHEHGHGLGLFHVCSSDTTQLMEPFINLAFDGLQHDDLRGGQRQHGDPFEPNDNAASASDLGMLALGSSVTVGSVPAPFIPNSSILSLEADGRQDWFRFSVSGPASVSVTVTPVGRVYDSSQETSQGCTSGHPIDSLRIADLDFAVLGVDGSTTLATGNTQPAGTLEQVIDVPLNNAGDYFVKVFESNSPQEPQLYFLTISIGDPPLCTGVNCDDGLFCNGLESCVQGMCVSGTAPCSTNQVCDETLQICTAAPGACCRTNGLCEIRAAADCPAGVGTFFGSGSACDDPSNPPCVPVPTIVSCQLSSASAFPGGRVTLELSIENVTALAWYNNIIDTSLLSGAGSAAPVCPAGVFVDTTRPDYVFAGLETSLDVDCAGARVGSFALSSTVNVAPSSQQYLGEYHLAVSPDATPGTQFVFTVLDQPSMSFLKTTGFVQDIPFRAGPPCTLTLLAPTACLAPMVQAVGPRYVAVTPAPGDFPVALRVQGSPNGFIPCVSGFVQLDGSLGDWPVYQLPPQWGTVLVHGPELVPSLGSSGAPVVPADYLVSADCNGAESSVSAVTTWLWGDSTNDGLIDVRDLVLAVDASRGVFTYTSLQATDMGGCAPDGQVDATDLQSFLDAFVGLLYGVIGCPSVCP